MNPIPKYFSNEVLLRKDFNSFEEKVGKQYTEVLVHDDDYTRKRQKSVVDEVDRMRNYLHHYHLKCRKERLELDSYIENRQGAICALGEMYVNEVRTRDNKLHDIHTLTETIETRQGQMQDMKDVHLQKIHALNLEKEESVTLLQNEINIIIHDIDSDTVSKKRKRQIEDIFHDTCDIVTQYIKDNHTQVKLETHHMNINPDNTWKTLADKESLRMLRIDQQCDYKIHNLITSINNHCTQLCERVKIDLENLEKNFFIEEYKQIEKQKIIDIDQTILLHTEAHRNSMSLIEIEIESRLKRLEEKQNEFDAKYK